MRRLFFITMAIGLLLCAAPALAGSPEITVALVGDLLLTDAALAGRGADYPWARVSGALQRADIAIGNLETAVSLQGAPVAGKQFTFRARPGALAGAARAGLDVVSLANNHTGDYGPQALLDTLQHVRAAGLHPVGAGRDAAEALRPAILETRGLKVAVLAFSRVIPEAGWVAGYQKPGLASGWDPAPVVAAVRKARSEADAVIVLMHWGEEAKAKPRPTDIDLARQLTAAGAAVVAGHHPHVLQGFRWHEQSLVAFSLGNFIFTHSANPAARETGILTVRLGAAGVSHAQFTPLVIVANQPRPAGRQAAAILDRVKRLSGPWGTAIRPDGHMVPPRPQLPPN